MKRSIMILMLLMVISGGGMAQSLSLLDAEGWLESAMVKWQSSTGHDSYNVYYSGEGLTDIKLDDQLIRSYGTYHRADAPGLKAGTYTFKVVAVDGENEVETLDGITVTVKAFDRRGFAFANNRVPGAYKADGRLKDGAVVLYITENTKNSIQLEVSGANANPCVGLQEILDGFKKGSDTRPLAVRFVGQITDMSYLLNGDVVVENKNNSSGYITLEGVGDDAVVDGWGIRIKNASNIELRNLGFMNCDSDEGDNIGLQQSNEYIWVHHCDLFYGGPGGDSDQAKGDGAMDCKRSTYVTVAYNHFWDTGKSCLLGLGENTTEGLFVTYHHNWFDHSDSRHPRVRFYSAHVYNNYFDGNSKYGVGATEGSSVFVEANYFRNCKYPMMISRQGTDIFYDSSGTFSGEDGGIIKACNNYIEGQRRFVAYGDPTVSDSDTQFDAYVAGTRDEQVAAGIVTAQGSYRYNNFDTDVALMYEYQPEEPSDARDIVMANAGRMFGGDFTWTFDNAVDDESYAVNTNLKSALVAYETALVGIQGDSDDNGPGDDDNGDSGEVVAGDMIHNFTSDGLVNSYYNISGNLSTSKGTVSYAGLTLTQCLKIESATSIQFTAAAAGTLTLVFNSDFSGKFKIDNLSYNAVNGIVETTLTAGVHTLSKGDVANLFYMSYVHDTSTGVGASEVLSLQVFPNPVRNMLTVQCDEEVKKVEIYNLQGVLMPFNQLSGGARDVSALKAGAYIVKVYTVNRCHTQTVLKR